MKNSKKNNKKNNKKNKGSATLEMTLVMPIIIVTFFIFIELLVSILDEARLRSEIVDSVSNLSLMKEIVEDIDIEERGIFSKYTLLENKVLVNSIRIKAETQMTTSSLMGKYSINSECNYSIAINNISKYLRGRQMIEERILQ